MLVDAAVAESLGSEFETVAREPVRLKGFSEPVEVFALKASG